MPPLRRNVGNPDVKLYMEAENRAGKALLSEQKFLIEAARDLPGGRGKRGRAVTRAGQFAAAQVAVRGMRKFVNAKSGETHKGINARRRPKEIVAEITANLWYILEYGRKAGTASSGRRYGSAPPHPFIERGFNATVDRQIKASIRTMRRRLAGFYARGEG